MLNQDFKEFIASLNANGVRYLVVGGCAVALHGHPRYTKDIDIWIEMNPENAAKVVKALDQFGFGSLGLKEGESQEEQAGIRSTSGPGRFRESGGGRLVMGTPQVRGCICLQTSS